MEDQKKPNTLIYHDLLLEMTSNTAFLDLAPDAIVVTDLNNNIIYKNQVSDRLISPGLKDSIGKCFIDYIPEEEREKIGKIFKKVVDDSEVIKNQELIIRGLMHNILYYLIIDLSPLRSKEEKIIGVLWIFRDVTGKNISVQEVINDNRKLEQKLQDSYINLELLKETASLNDDVVNNIPIGILIIDKDGTVLSQNPALKDILNPGPGHREPGLGFYSYIKSDFKLRQSLDNALSDKKPVRIDQLKYTSDHSKEIIINIWIVPVQDSQKNMKCLAFLVEDVTKNSLIGSKMQRAVRLSAMGILASGIAEEIKWPLSHIMMNLDFVERNTSEDSPVKYYLQAIKDDLSRIKFVSKQIRSLSIPQNEENKEVYELNKLFSSHPLKVKLNVLKERGIEIKTILSDKSPMIRANEDQLIQAMTHIIQNAAEAMPEEGTLTILTNTIQENEHYVAVITIKDTGFGIPQENLPNIFKPFYTTKGKSATGLGLMVAYSIIDNLGGAIGIKSTPGEGTTVRIILPAYTEEK